MFTTNRALRSAHLGLLSFVLLVSSGAAIPATTTIFQANDSHRVLGLNAKTNSPTVTRMEFEIHRFSATVAVPPKPIVIKPRIVPRASRTRRFAPKAYLYAQTHTIYHTSNCPAGPQWVVDLAHQRVASKFGEAQWPYAKRLWTKESNFNPWCENSIGAYGVPQAYPGSKMGGNWRFDVRHQIEWGVEYIAGKYVTPEAAMAHSERYNSY